RDVTNDLQYVLEEHFNNNDEVEDFRSIDKFTRLNQQRLILELYGYRNCGVKERNKIQKKARQVVTISSKPIFIFREIMNYLSEHCLVTPGYSFIQETIGRAITLEQNRLTSVMRQYLRPSDREDLRLLLEDSHGLYEITRLKREPKDFSLKEIKSEIHRGKQIRSLYLLASTILPALKISNESIKHYASLVDYYSVFRLKRLDEGIVYVYLLCYISYRYQRMNDNLINTFIYNIRRYINEAKATAKDQIYDYYKENRTNMKKASEVLKLFTSENIAPNAPFRDIQEKAFSILAPQQLESVVNKMETKAKRDEASLQWDYINRLSSQFERRLRPLLLMVDFAASTNNDSLMEAIDFVKQAFQQNKSLRQYATESLPQRFISNNMKHYIYERKVDGEKNINTDRYEFLIYQLLRNRLEAGDAFCHDSIRFRSFEDDLLAEDKWQQKDKLLADTGLNIFRQPVDEHLNELKQRVERRLKEVNQRIASGRNEHVRQKRGRHGQWTLINQRETEDINHSFFNALNTIDIGSILQYANQDCYFLDVFHH